LGLAVSIGFCGIKVKLLFHSPIDTAKPNIAFDNQAKQALACSLGSQNLNRNQNLQGGYTMTKLQLKEKSIAKEWAAYYERKNEHVTSAMAYRVGRKDKDGFYKFRVIVNIKLHHAFVLEVYEKVD